METDLLIIGSGLAGLACAIRFAEKNPNRQVVVLDKSLRGESNTLHAQGGIAAVLQGNGDKITQHVQDTLSAGNGHCQPERVERILSAASKAIEQLIHWGVHFDRDAAGKFDLALEGGHSRPRILHVQDRTGRAIIEQLQEKARLLTNIQVLKGHFALDLITEKGKDGRTFCLGALVAHIQGQELINIRAGQTVLATGGSGQVFARTTNPEVATGDGVAMAARAGAQIADMHFFQFHPTVYFNPKNQRTFLLTEALRGAGAFVVNHHQERFLFKGDHRGELATRDIVSMLIQEELAASGKENVYLDARHLGMERLMKEFPGVVSSCLSEGLDLSQDLIPIAPAAHYQCGGVAVDDKGQTTIQQLFALGECAHTGLHGSNRLASNSLLEALVCALEIAENIDRSKNNEVTLLKELPSPYPYTTQGTFDVEEILKGLQLNMTRLGNQIPAIKPHFLRQLSNQVLHWKASVYQAYSQGQWSLPLFELRNLLEVADVMCRHHQDQLAHVEHYQDI